MVKEALGDVDNRPWGHKPGRCHRILESVVTSSCLRRKFERLPVSTTGFIYRTIFFWWNMGTITSLFSRLLQPVQSQQLTSWLFLKSLALIYLAAFASLAVQIAGLVGPEGIMPLNQQLDESYQQLGYTAWLWFPLILLHFARP